MKKLYASLLLAFSITQMQAQCPILRGVLVNPCGDEGINEFAVFTTTTTAPVSNYTLYYGSVDVPSRQTTPSGLFKGASATAKTGTGTILTALGCNIIPVTSPSTSIPLGSTVIFIPSGFNNTFDISPFCSFGVTAYVVYLDTASSSGNRWNSGGTYANNPGTSTYRYLQVINATDSCFTGIKAYRSGWGGNADGNFVVWNGSDTTYLNGGCDLITVPLKLLSFNAIGAGKDAHIVWQTANETATKLFELERSADGKNFKSIKTIDAAGNANGTRDYAFDDINIPAGVSYYRLKMMDIDGKITYSQVVKVVSTTNGLVITNIFPRPATTSIALSWNAPTPGTTIARVFDYTGRMLKSVNMSTATGMNFYKMPISDLPKGGYLIKLQKDNETVVSKFVKQ